MGIFNNNKKPYWSLLPIMVVLTILMLLMNSYMPPSDLAPPGYSSVILAFEFAQTRNEVNEVMIPLSASHIRGLDIVQYIDFGYMVAYSILLGGFFWITKKLTGQRYQILGIILAGVALVADFFENIQLLDLTRMFVSLAEPSTYESVLSNLFIFTWLKWGSLAVAMGLLVPSLIKRGLFSKIIAVILAIAPIMLLLVALLGTRSIMDKFGTSVIFAFLAIAIYAIAYRHPETS